jgi:MFS transporter, ACS family, hexuronate transporter
MKRIKNLRWYIAIMLAAACALSYMDRLSLPIAVSEIDKTIPISDKDFGLLMSLFFFAYAIMYAVGGKILDWLGTRSGYALMIIWWSLATMMQGLVSSIAGFGIARFLLGMGEGGGFPGSAKAVSEWFPAKERAFAFGIFNTGSSVGAVMAPLIISSIIGFSSWRWVFILTGATGVIWVLIWLIFYYKPQKNKFITEKEKKYILDGLPKESKDDGPKIRWIDLFQFRQVWGLLIIKFFTDAAWYFFISWLPKYLADARNLDTKEVGYYAWIPFLFAAIGSFAGGWLSSFLVKKNFSIDKSRKIALGISAFLMPFSLFIVQSPISYAIVFFSMAYLGHQFWATIVQTLAADMFPSKVVGSVAGLMGCVGAFGGALLNLAAGYIVDAAGYTPLFIIGGILHPLSFVLIFVIIRKIELVTKPVVNYAK